MSLYLDKILQSPGSRLLVRRTFESTEELIELAKLSTSELKYLETIRLEKRRREWLDTQILLREFYPDKKLSYLSNGKPVFTDGSHLSISHCEDFVGIAISPRPVGLDIQNPNKSLLKIQKKFCNGIELAFIPAGENGLELTTVIWSAKEAIFKVFGERVLFADDITVLPFRIEDEIVRAGYRGVHGERLFELEHLCCDGFHFVIAG